LNPQILVSSELFGVPTADPSTLTTGNPFFGQVPALKQVIANDMEPGAVETIRRNAEFSRSQDKVVPNEGDAIMVMMQHRHHISHSTHGGTVAG